MDAASACAIAAGCGEGKYGFASDDRNDGADDVPVEVLCGGEDDPAEAGNDDPSDDKADGGMCGNMCGWEVTVFIYRDVIG